MFCHEREKQQNEAELGKGETQNEEGEGGWQGFRKAALGGGGVSVGDECRDKSAPNRGRKGSVGSRRKGVDKGGKRKREGSRIVQRKGMEKLGEVGYGDDGDGV